MLMKTGIETKQPFTRSLFHNETKAICRNINNCLQHMTQLLFWLYFCPQNATFAQLDVLQILLGYLRLEGYVMLFRSVKEELQNGEIKAVTLIIVQHSFIYFVQLLFLTQHNLAPLQSFQLHSQAPPNGQSELPSRKWSWWDQAQMGQEH